MFDKRFHRTTYLCMKRFHEEFLFGVSRKTSGSFVCTDRDMWLAQLGGYVRVIAHEDFELVLLVKWFSVRDQGL